MMYQDEEEIINEMIGKIFLSVTGEIGGSELKFISSNGEIYKFYHAQDCCENVEINDIIGDLSDLIGEPLLISEMVTSQENPNGVNIESQDSFTWTFYKFATVKGYVTIRWYGESNGYYSERVDVCKLKNSEDF